MRAVLALGLLAACGDVHPGPDGGAGMVRVTAYGRASCGTAGVLASGVEIRSYDATVDADLGHNTFATANTDANGVAVLDVPRGGYIVYDACGSSALPRWIESIQGIEPGDDLIVGDPTSTFVCPTNVGSMTVEFPTIANATSYQANGATSPSPSVVVSGCDGAPCTVLGQAFDSTGQSLGYQSQTVTFVDQSTVQLGALMPLAVLDLTVNPAPPYPPLLTEKAASVTWQNVATGNGGAYRYVYPRIADACTVQWEEGELAIATDETSVSADLVQLAQLPYSATRTIGETGSLYDDQQADVEYLVDTPPGAQPSLSFLALPDPSDRYHYNAYRAYAINDAQYDGYDDFRNQHRHLDRKVDRSIVNSDGAGYLIPCLTCWPTPR